MTDHRSLLEREMKRVELRPFPLDGFYRRRDRKRRNQRIAAVVVAIVVFAAPLWIFATGGPFDRSQTPGATAAPRPTGMGLFGLPPEGATPSTPEHGRLVLRIGFGHTDGDPGRFSLHMYADGRVIWQRLGDRPGEGTATSTGLIEQRLTPMGVELVLSDVLSTGLFDRDRVFAAAPGLHYGGIQIRTGDQRVELAWGDAGFEVGIDATPTTPTPEQVQAIELIDTRLEDLTSWLPASAWEDPGSRAYVPSRYTVCYMGLDVALGRQRILDLLPTPAADLLRPLDRTQSYANGFRGSLPYWCSLVTMEQARELAPILEPYRRSGEGLSFAYRPGGQSFEGVDIELAPALPHE